MAAVVPILLSGCAGGSGATKTEPVLISPPIPSPSPSSASGTSSDAGASSYSLPLEQFGVQSDAETAVLVRMMGVLTARCMAKKGFDYKPEQGNAPSRTPAAGGSTAQQFLPAPYGIVDLAQARQFGYSAPDGAHRATLDDAKRLGADPAAMVAQHGAAWVRALYGFVPPEQPPTPLVGCLYHQGDAVYDSAFTKVDRNLPGKLSEQAARASASDDRVAKVVAAWSTCMRGRGYTFSNPMVPAQRRWPQPADGAQIATAVADVECKQSTDLPRVWRTIETGYQQQLVDKNIAALQEYDKAVHQVVIGAQAVIGQG
jgi:hypothetical protein